ncbi:MAG: hypothetical protein Q9225_004037 [Loekoesia sp. 1 TL-2023]
MGKSKKSKPTKATPPDDTSPTKSSTSVSEPTNTLPNHKEQDASLAGPEATDFESFYLKKVTAEFADDLDKLRAASDFNEKSLPILIDALKGTAGVYSEEDKAKVMGKR